MSPVDTAIVAEARALFERQRAPRWAMAATTARQRQQRLRGLKQAILVRRADLAAALHADFRKHPAESELTEIHVTLAELDFAIDHLPRWMAPRRRPTPLLLASSRSEIRCEPRGVALVLSPWNYPVYLTLAPLVGAMAAGNCAIVRPSEKVPHTSAVLRAIVADAGPPEELALVEGDVPVAEALLALPFDHVFFSGSARVGQRVMTAAAAHLASVTLELGGKSPAIIDTSADVERAAERVMWGKCLNAGQTCVAPDYVLVPRALEPSFVDGCSRALRHMYGDGDDAVRRSGDYCRMIDDAAFARVARLVGDTIAEGAVIAVGGLMDESDRFIAPTVLTGVRDDAPIMGEEIFGPILPVVAYDTLDEALGVVRRHGKPLALYVFARDGAATERILRETTAGGTCVNDVAVHIATPWLPFGGVGASGIGSYHGEAGFRAFSHERSVLRQGPLALARLLRPPYESRMNRFARRVVRQFE